MPYNGAGVYSPPAADFPAVSGTLIQSTKFNNVINDIATGLTTALTKDGQTTPTANLPMGSFKHLLVADAALRTQYSSAGQVQDNAFRWAGVAGGTADALALTLSPVLAGYTPGQIFYFQAGASPNTGAATLSISGLLAKNLRLNGSALIAGDIEANKYYSVMYDGFFHIQKVSPNSIQLAGTNPWTGTNTFVDTGFKVIGSSDATKKARFEVDGLTTGTERVITVPDADITLANWSTGDVKMTLKTVADSGWVLMNDGTIGNGSSGGTTRANADTVDLFTLLWNNTVNGDCAVSTGRGANAAADFAANKTIALPKALGRALAAYGSGSGLTARALANVQGVESVTLTAAQSGLPDHTHLLTVGPGIGSNQQVNGQATTASSGNLGTGAVTGGAQNASSSHTNMQPTVFLNVMIKL